MKVKFKFLALAAASCAAIAGLAHSAVISLGTSATQAPTSVPTLTVEAGDSISLSLWAQGQGSGYLQGTAVSVYQGSAASWNGGQISATNAFPAANFVDAREDMVVAFFRLGRDAAAANGLVGPRGIEDDALDFRATQVDAPQDRHISLKW